MRDVLRETHGVSAISRSCEATKSWCWQQSLPVPLDQRISISLYHCIPFLYCVPSCPRSIMYCSVDWAKLWRMFYFFNALRVDLACLCHPWLCGCEHDTKTAGALSLPARCYERTKMWRWSRCKAMLPLWNSSRTPCAKIQALWHYQQDWHCLWRTKEFGVPLQSVPIKKLYDSKLYTVYIHNIVISFRFML